MSNFEQYQALISEFGKSLGFDQVHLIDEMVFSLDIDQQYELNYLYGNDSNRLLIVSYFSPNTQTTVTERNLALLEANVGLSGAFIIKYGFVEKVNKAAFSLELMMDSSLDVSQLTKATQALMETTEHWIEELSQPSSDLVEHDELLEMSMKV